MPGRPLDNYLRTYRRRAGFSQDEVAFLLGCKSGTKVSRYERRSRKPPLETAFAYEVIFGEPGPELFAGVFGKVEKKIMKRAHLLARKLEKPDPDPLTVRKLEILKAISSGSTRGPERS